MTSNNNRCFYCHVLVLNNDSFKVPVSGQRLCAKCALMYEGQQQNLDRYKPHGEDQK